MRKPFVFDKADVSIGGGAGRLGRRKARFSRASSESSSHLTLTHVPTGVRVSGAVMPGHYSRKELGRLNEQLRSVLYTRLEYEVSKKLRAPGRKTLTRFEEPDDERFKIVVG